MMIEVLRQNLTILGKTWHDLAKLRHNEFIEQCYG